MKPETLCDDCDAPATVTIAEHDYYCQLHAPKCEEPGCTNVAQYSQWFGRSAETGFCLCKGHLVPETPTIDLEVKPI